MFESISNFFFEHIPFFATLGFFTYLTVVLDDRILSARTIEEQFGGSESFYWASMCLPIIMVPLAGSIGIFWPDPEAQHWDSKWGVCYFGSAGFFSQLFWLGLKWLAEKKGIKLRLPGTSIIPPKSKKIESVDVDIHDIK